MKQSTVTEKRPSNIFAPFLSSLCLCFCFVSHGFFFYICFIIHLLLSLRSLLLLLLLLILFLLAYNVIRVTKRCKTSMLNVGVNNNHRTCRVCRSSTNTVELFVHFYFSKQFHNFLDFLHSDLSINLKNKNE